MFAKVFRLPFSQRFLHASVIRSPLFTVKIQKNNVIHNRYGFIVGKTVDRRAVYRNSLKRKLRSQIEHRNALFTQGYDFLFIVKKQIFSKEATIQELDKIQKEL